MISGAGAIPRRFSLPAESALRPERSTKAPANRPQNGLERPQPARETVKPGPRLLAAALRLPSRRALPANW